MRLTPRDWCLGVIVLATLSGSLDSRAADDAPATAPAPAAANDSADPADPAEEELRFVSYNLKNYLPMERRVGGEVVEDAPKPEEEIQLLVQIIASTSPDVLGVCEIGGMAEVTDLQARLKALGVDLPHVSWLDAYDETRHLAIFSRYPIVEVNSRGDLTYQLDGAEFQLRRGLLDVTIEFPDAYQVRFIGAHFKSKRPLREADEALMRRNEAQLARDHVDDILAEDPDVNLLLYGDLNDTRNEAPIRALQGGFGKDGYLKDIQIADSDGYRWTYYWSYGDIYSRFDFVMASAGITREINYDASYIAKGEDWYTASDHRPLVIVLEGEDE